MSDIAEIGFKADTSDLSDAMVKLEQLSPTAAKVEGNVDRLNATMLKLISTMERSTVRASRGVSANDNLGKSYAKLETTMERVNKLTGVSKTSAIAQGASYDALGQKVESLRSKYNPLYAVISRYKKNIADIRSANSLGALSLNEMTEAISRQRRAALTAIGAIKANAKAVEQYGVKSGARHNVGNLAAQFQDIGVTAAMGMNPLMVALQQGTQISAVLGPLGMAGAVKSLGAALQAVLSPMALMTIAFTALAVVGIQMVEWSALAKNSLNGLADILPSVAKYSALAAVGLALMYTPSIINGARALPGLVLALSKRLWGVAAALYATVGLPVLLVAGFVAIVAAANVFHDDLTRILGFDIVDSAKQGVNFIIGIFVGGYKSIVKTWAILPMAFSDIAVQAVNGALKHIVKFTKKTRNVLNSLPGVNIPILPENVSLIKNRFKGVAKAVGQVFDTEFKGAIDTDYIGNIATGITDMANKAGAKLRKIASGISTEDGKEKKDSFKKIVSGSQSDSASVRAEIEGLNMTSSAARALKNETDLLNKARNAGIKLTPAQTTQLKELAATYTALQTTLESGKFIKEMTVASEGNVISLQAERQALGLVGEELEKLKARTEILAAIKKSETSLTDTQTESLLKQAEAVAVLRSQNAIEKSFNDQSAALEESVLTQKTEIEALGLTESAAAALRFERKLLNDEMFRGVAMSPAQQQALKDEAASLNILQQQYTKMKEKIDFAKSTTKSFFSEMQSGLAKGKNLFTTFADSVVNSLNKILDRLLDKAFDKLIDGIFSGGSGGGIVSSVGKALGFAKGGAFDNSSQKFAKGGTFTNTVVNKPTMFQFAKGGALGEMGEAGPEAIIPLKRGADGSLGVQMYGGNQGGSNERPVANMNFVTKQTISGAVSSQDIVALMRQQSEQQQQDTRRSVLAWLQQEQVDGAVA